jgi:hypothetical protein
MDTPEDGENVKYRKQTILCLYLYTPFATILTLI